MLLHFPASLDPADAAAALCRGDLQVVDVRDAGEVFRARVDGAVHIPLGELYRRMRELDRSRPVAFLCASGSRSALATRVAAKAGLDARNIRGGIKAWQRAGLPVTTTPQGAA